MICPNCGTKSGPFETERRPLGDTKCGGCGFKTMSTDFYPHDKHDPHGEKKTESGIIIPISKEKRQSPEFEMLMDRYDEQSKKLLELDDVNTRLAKAITDKNEAYEMLKMVLEPRDMMMNRDAVPERISMFLKSKGAINASSRY